MKKPTPPSLQRGATLLVGLIMLVLITMLAVSAIRLSTLNQMVVGNEQYQMEAEDAAAYELDRLIGNENFIDANLNATRSLPAFRAVGSAGDAAAADSTTYVVRVQPPDCKRYRYLKVGELLDAEGYPKTADDAACMGVPPGEVLIVDATTASDNSLCATSLWELTANVQIPDTGANVGVIQGVEMRLDWSEAKTACED